MRTNIKYIIPGACFLMVPFLMRTASARENHWKISLQAGIFIPQDGSIMGTQQVYYTGGSPSSIYVTGFGQGNDINLTGSYFYSDFHAESRRQAVQK